MPPGQCPFVTEEVTAPRVDIFREAILEVLEMERQRLVASFGGSAFGGFPQLQRKGQGKSLPFWCWMTSVLKAG